MTAFTREHTAGEIVKEYPKASDLFKQYRIDFCCGGNRPLTEVLVEKGIDEEAFLMQLNGSFIDWQEKGNQATNWEEAPYTNLIDHIVETHHAFLVEELPALGQFVTKIYRVHGNSHPELKDVHQLYHTLKTELEQHLIKEEDDIFPLVKQYEKNPTAELRDQILEANSSLEDEHDAAGDIIKKLREITGDFIPPADGCSSYRITYQRLAELEEDLFQHIHLENNILFPRLATA